MFSPYVGGSSITVGDVELALKVHLPPTGMVWNHDTGELEWSEVICRSAIASEQYWQRPQPPASYWRKAQREKELQVNDPEFTDPELKAYRQREWHRRLYGAWFMNNGEYVYLTGPYYFYLTHWTIDIGAPHFKIADLHKAYFWQYCTEDPLCYGMVEMTKRRVGKTYFGACMLYEYVSRTSNAHAGIQSKTNADAKLVFSEKLVQPWRKVIDFFRPDYDRSSGDVPKTEMRFFKTSRKGSKTVEVYDEGGELESWIDFLNSGTHAYDGQKMLRYLCDEVFKTIEADIGKRHAVIKPCLEDESGNIIGKAIYTSTVEEMEGHVEKYVDLWKKSDFTKKNANGLTESGLYRFFTPAQKLMYTDRYGYPDEERALKKIENDLAAMDDPRDRAAYIKMNPRTWQEAFKFGGDKCLFDPIKIEDRLAVIRYKDPEDLYTRYNLIWDVDVPDGELPKVKLVKNRNGKFRFAWKFADPLQANDVIRRGTHFLPKNNLRFVVGIDPFDHNRTKDGHFSNGAALVYMKFDPFDPESTDRFVVYYKARPSNSVIFYEDMVMLCHYFSCQMLFEDNKPKIADHFVDRGYGHFLVRDEKGHPGISASPKTHQVLAEHIEGYVDENCDKVDFIDLLEDWLMLDLDDTTACDVGMASGYTLIAANRLLRKQKILNKLRVPTKTGFVRKFFIGKKNAKFSNAKFSQSLRQSR